MSDIKEEIEAWRETLARSRADQDKRFARHDRALKLLMWALAFVAIANLLNATLEAWRIVECRQ